MINAVFLFPDYDVPIRLPTQDSATTLCDEDHKESDSDSDEEYFSETEPPFKKNQFEPRQAVLDEQKPVVTKIPVPELQVVQLSGHADPDEEGSTTESDSSSTPELDDVSLLQVAAQQRPSISTASELNQEHASSLTCLIPPDGAPEDRVDRQEFRITQISSYFSLKQRQEAFAALLQLKDCLNLEGDFECLEMLHVKISHYLNFH